MDKILLRLRDEFNLQDYQVINVASLLSEGNTIPFIARYRKEKTGSLDDQILREFADRLQYLNTLEDKKQEICRLIDEQEKLTDEIKIAIEAAETLQELEDIYRPYRPKRRTKATIAKEKGLEPLAQIILAQDMSYDEFNEKVLEFLNEEKDVHTAEDAISGAMDILAEIISDNADFRKEIRNITYNEASLLSACAKEEDSVYRLYYDFNEPVRSIANHRILAINRGEKEGFLKVSLDLAPTHIINFLSRELVKSPQAATSEYVLASLEDAYKRLIAPSIENEIRNILTEKAGEDAISLFSVNLSKLLLQPPIRNRVVLGLDPGYRTGCKACVVDETGKVLSTGVIYCTLPHHNKSEAETFVLSAIRKYGVSLISIGNGTATKETEIFVSDLIKKENLSVQYMVVSESGASVYSASKLAAEEFPDYDVALRSAVSIARRLQDPLAELVKIDPKAIGVGQYQHDMNQKRLTDALGGVVEACVNSVGVDLNTASAPLLSYIAGISSSLAKNIVKYREENGKFTERKQLLKVPKLGPKAYEQCAGFLRIPGSKNVLDNTSVHPESYMQTESLIRKLGFSLEDISNRFDDFKNKVKDENINKLADELGLGIPTLCDIIDSVSKPGRDPRDELPQPILMSELLSIKDLKEGMVLTGTVRNVIDFGAFVDIGVHQDGLVHISQICDRYIKHPIDALSVGDIVKVKIIGLDIEKNRISLSIKDAK